MNTDIPGSLLWLLNGKDLTIQSAGVSFSEFNFACEKLRNELKKQRNFTKLMELLEERNECIWKYVIKILSKTIEKGPKEFGKLFGKVKATEKLINLRERITEEKSLRKVKNLLKEISAYEQLYNHWILVQS